MLIFLISLVFSLPPAPSLANEITKKIRDKTMECLNELDRLKKANEAPNESSQNSKERLLSSMEDLVFASCEIGFAKEKNLNWIQLQRHLMISDDDKTRKEFKKCIDEIKYHVNECLDFHVKKLDPNIRECARNDLYELYKNSFKGYFTNR